MKIFDKITYTRSGKRPVASEYIASLCDEGSFCELHGDRRFGDDSAVIGGVARINGAPVTVIGIEKGRDTADKIKHNFGQASPEGYRKALRLMKQAEKFHRPVLCLVDTAGANCGIGAEERGQGSAIAENMYEMMTLRTPILSVFIGEGGSGGALALAVCDEVWMNENAYYSVVSPEGCASILWKSAAEAPRAAEALKPDADTLKSLGVCERIIAEPESFDDEKKVAEWYSKLKNSVSDKLSELCRRSEKKLLSDRYEKFRRVGEYDGSCN